jgi:hypothetical protein
MEVLVKVTRKGELENFTSQNSGETVPKLAMNLACGADQFTATAFDKEAIRLHQSEIDLGTVYVANLSFTVSKGERGEFQNVRINKLLPF